MSPAPTSEPEPVANHDVAEAKPLRGERLVVHRRDGRAEVMARFHIDFSARVFFADELAHATSTDAEAYDYVVERSERYVKATFATLKLTHHARSTLADREFLRLVFGTVRYKAIKTLLAEPSPQIERRSSEISDIVVDELTRNPTAACLTPACWNLQRPNAAHSVDLANPVERDLALLHVVTAMREQERELGSHEVLASLL